MRLRALTWNVFHGRDLPPDPALVTWRSRLFRVSERNDTHVQVNRDLFDEFAAILAGADWDVLLLQELPPRWTVPLASRCEATAHGTLTSRNSLGPVRRLAARLNPDLVASHEGGSNAILVRRRAGALVEGGELELRAHRRPERRALGFARVRLSDQPIAGQPIEICVGNLHASTGRAHQLLAEEECEIAAERCVEWARSGPLILGGDFNVRPRDSELFERLAQRHSLEGVTAPDAIDHLLARGLERIGDPRAWDPEEREVRTGGLAIRLSDHAPVESVFAVGRRDQRARRPRVG